MTKTCLLSVGGERRGEDYEWDAEKNKTKCVIVARQNDENIPLERREAFPMARVANKATVVRVGAILLPISLKVKSCERVKSRRREDSNTCIYNLRCTPRYHNPPHNFSWSDSNAAHLAMR